MKKILLNNQDLHPSRQDMPMLIHGIDHSGASLFTIMLAADLYKKGEKFLFISGYHYARDEFIEQTGDDSQIVVAEKVTDPAELAQKPVVFVKWEDCDLFVDLAQSLPDANDRILLVKNIDIMPEMVYDVAANKNSSIISGDIERCAYRGKIFEKDFKTQVFFSKPERNIDIVVPPLEKYAGYMIAPDKKGIVTKLLD